MKIYDCSNSEERPTNRGYGGSIENAVVTLLKKYGPSYNVDFVDNPTEADLLFTNDVFPKGLPNLPKVKRMDGIFWQENLKDRNIPLNEAALESNLVIFISQFSLISLKELYETTYLNLKDYRIIVNWVDDEIFYPAANRTFPILPEKFIAVATSWERQEKRLTSTLNFATLIPNSQLFIVGHIPEGTVLPNNVISLGYMSEYRLANTLREMDAMVNLSYRDACPKTVAEGLACGLPVIFAYSGGTRELVFGPWQGIFEMNLETTNEITRAIKLFLEHYRQNSTKNRFPLTAKDYPANERGKSKTQILVQKYIQAFKDTINEH